MNRTKKISGAVIRSGLTLWNDYSHTLMDGHLPEDRLYDFLTGILPDRIKSEIIEHLSFCSTCRNQLWKMKQHIRRAENHLLDVALPKAAASQEKTTFSILTQSGRCRILFRKLLNQKGKGVINLRVEPRYGKALEGKTLRVTDKNGKELIHGEVLNGETEGRLVDADEIDWETLIVTENI